MAWTLEKLCLLKPIYIIMLISFVMMFGGGDVYATLIFNGVTDGGAGDPDGLADGLIILAGFILPSGINFSGTVKEIKTATSNHIIITNATYFNPTAAAITANDVIMNNYNFNGGGRLISVINGTLSNPALPAGSLGGENFTLSIGATTFNNNFAVANWAGVPVGTPLSTPVTGFAEKNGFYNGQGQLIGNMQYTLGAGEQFIFPTSLDLIAVVPEPSTYLLFAVGILGILGMGYRRRKKAA